MNKLALKESEAEMQLTSRVIMSGQLRVHSSNGMMILQLKSTYVMFMFTVQLVVFELRHHECSKSNQVLPHAELHPAVVNA